MSREFLFIKFYFLFSRKASWKKELEEKRDILLLHDKMSVKLDQYTTREREGAVSALKQPLGCNEETPDSMYGTQGSFRKLEVD